MTHIEIENELRRLVREERKITNEILRMINLAFDRRTYLERGFPSMFEWLTKGFGYSNAAAFRRIEAAKLLRSVPAAAKKLEEGKLNLSGLSQVQSMVKATEKVSGRKVGVEEKEKALKEIEEMSGVEVERTLFSIFPEARKEIHKEHKRVIDDSTVRHTMNFSKEMSENLKRLKELLSHKMPNASDAEVIGYALKKLLEELDPIKESLRKDKVKKVESGKNKFESNMKRADSRTMTQTASAAEVANEGVIEKIGKEGLAGGQNKRAVGRKLKLKIMQQAQAKCCFKDPSTGKVCDSQYQLEIDHIIPRMLGGTNEPENLRVLCKQHNLLMAEKKLGRWVREKFGR